MQDWLKTLRHDPLRPLLDCSDPAVACFADRDLSGNRARSVDSIPELPQVRAIVRKQRADGSWKSPNKNARTRLATNYSLIETWRQLRFLVQQYQLDRSHLCVQNAAEFILSCQTEEGDIRGFLADQYATYYTGAVLSLLVAAGYGEDPRVQKAFQWLLSMRQEDGGWVGTPWITLEGYTWADAVALSSQHHETLKEGDRTKPSCQNSTGMVIRAFALHARYRRTKEAMTAACWLKGRFFRENHYSSYRHPDHWLAFQFPYWWNNLVAALDSVSSIIRDEDDPDIAGAVDWLVAHQEASGLWKTSYSSIHKNTVTPRTKEAQLWVTLVICRILKRILARGG